MRTTAQLNLIRALCTRQDEKTAFVGHALRFGAKALLGTGKAGIFAAKKALPLAGKAAKGVGGFAWKHPGATIGAGVTGTFLASDMAKAYKTSAPLRGKAQLRDLARNIPVPR